MCWKSAQSRLRRISHAPILKFVSDLSAGNKLSWLHAPTLGPSRTGERLCEGFDQFRVAHRVIELYPGYPEDFSREHCRRRRGAQPTTQAKTISGGAVQPYSREWDRH